MRIDSMVRAPTSLAATMDPQAAAEQAQRQAQQQSYGPGAAAIGAVQSQLRPGLVSGAMSLAQSMAHGRPAAPQPGTMRTTGGRAMVSPQSGGGGAASPQPRAPMSSQQAPMRPDAYGTAGGANRIYNGSGEFIGTDPNHPGYITDGRGTPIPIDTGMMGDPRQQVQKWGTDAPKAFALPAIRVPGIDFDRADFAYGGVDQGQWNGTADEFRNRNNPTGDWAQANDARDRMAQGGLQSLAEAQDFYRGQMNGTGPNLAETQLQAGVDKSIASQMAMANSQRGGGLAQASAMRGAQLQGGQMQAGMANQAAMLRQQQQLAGAQGFTGAAGQYGSLANAMRSGDIGMQQAALGAYYQGRGQNDAAAMGLFGLGHQASLADMEARQKFGLAQGQANFNTQVQNAGFERGVAAEELSFLPRL